MGCAPSRPNSSIRVEQRLPVEPELPDEGWRTPDNNWLINDTSSQKEIFEILDDEDADTDKSSDSFLQVKYNTNIIV